MSAKNVLTGVAGAGIIGLILFGVICGVQLNGKVSIGFEDFRIEARYKKYSVTWLDSNGDELQKDEELETGSRSTYRGSLPERDGYVFVGFENAEINSTNNYYTIVETSNITCTAVYEALQVTE